MTNVITMLSPYGNGGNRLTSCEIPGTGYYANSSGQFMANVGDIGLLTQMGCSIASNNLKQSTPIVIPPGALAVYSVIQVNGYSGNCLRVQRASDNAQFDVGFFNGAADWAGADAFAAGSILTVVKWYDQSGNGNHLVPSTGVLPYFTGYSNFNGVRGVNFNSIGLTSSQALTVPLTLNMNNFSLYSVFNMRVANVPTAIASFQQAGASQDPFILFTSDTPLLRWSLNWPGGFFTPLPFVSPEMMSYFSVSGSGFVNANGAAVTGYPPSSTQIDHFSLGGSTVNPYYFTGDIFFAAIYPANHSAAQQAQINSAAFSPFSDGIIKSKQLLYDGNSIAAGVANSYGMNLPYQMGFSRTKAEDDNGLFPNPSLPEWIVYNTAVPGATIAARATNGPAQCMTQLGPLPSGFTKNIAVICEATNDIAGSTYTSTANAQSAMSTLWTGTVLPLITALLADGYTGVVVPTVIPRNGFTAGSGNYYEDARIAYNNLVMTSVVGNGYVVSDRASLGPFSKTNSWQNSAYYSSDGIHPVNLGYSVLAACDRAAILSL